MGTHPRKDSKTNSYNNGDDHTPDSDSAFDSAIDYSDDHSDNSAVTIDNFLSEISLNSSSDTSSPISIDLSQNPFAYNDDVAFTADIIDRDSETYVLSKTARDTDRYRDSRNSDKIESTEYRRARAEYQEKIILQSQGEILDQPPIRPIKGNSSGLFKQQNKPTKFELVRDALDLDADSDSDSDSDSDYDSVYDSDSDSDSNSNSPSQRI